MKAKVSVDQAGRVLLPKALREDLRLGLSDVVELDSEREDIRLRPVRPKALVKREHGGVGLSGGTGRGCFAALLFVQEVRDRCRVITLDDEESWSTIAGAAEKGFTSGRIYDAHLLRCATKANARWIYTWNLKHFRAIEPEWTDHMRTP